MGVNEALEYTSLLSIKGLHFEWCQETIIIDFSTVPYLSYLFLQYECVWFHIWVICSSSMSVCGSIFELSVPPVWVCVVRYLSYLFLQYEMCVVTGHEMAPYILQHQPNWWVPSLQPAWQATGKCGLQLLGKCYLKLLSSLIEHMSLYAMHNITYMLNNHGSFNLKVWSLIAHLSLFALWVI